MKRQRPLTNIKQEVGEESAKQEHPVQSQLIVAGNDAAVAAQVHVDYHAPAFPGMEQLRVLGVTLQQVQMQLVEFQARINILEVEGISKDSEIARSQAETARLQLELAQRDAELSQRELHFDHQRQQIASMQQPSKQGSDHVMRFLPDRPSLFSGVRTNSITPTRAYCGPLSAPLLMFA